jgi:predicted RNA-binding protein YlqC (UPF0109 family)
VSWTLENASLTAAGASELDNAQRVAKVHRVRQFLEFIVRHLVEFPDEVMLSEIPSGRMTVFRLQMRQTDVGRIIGRNGQTIRAIRALLASAASRHGERATLDIVEWEEAASDPARLVLIFTCKSTRSSHPRQPCP